VLGCLAVKIVWSWALYCDEARTKLRPELQKELILDQMSYWLLNKFVSSAFQVKDCDPQDWHDWKLSTPAPGLAYPLAVSLLLACGIWADTKHAWHLDGGL